MPEQEFQSWREFYRLHPFDDFHRFYRPAAMVATAFGGELQPRLDWLQPPAVIGGHADVEAFIDSDIRTLSTFGLIRN